MIVKINGQQQQLNPDTPLIQLLDAKNIQLDTVVVEYNYDILPKEKWAQVILKPGDNLEVLHFVGGG